MPLNGVMSRSASWRSAIGSVYPVATVSIQNALARHQVGIAMGAMNFFRSLGSALVVAMMGAIILAWLGAAPERGTGTGSLAALAASRGIDMADVFAYVFVAAAICLALALVSIAAMEERPLRGPATPTPASTISADPGPATPSG